MGDEAGKETQTDASFQQVELNTCRLLFLSNQFSGAFFKEDVALGRGPETMERSLSRRGMGVGGGRSTGEFVFHWGCECGENLGSGSGLDMLVRNTFTALDFPALAIVRCLAERRTSSGRYRFRLGDEKTSLLNRKLHGMKDFASLDKVDNGFIGTGSVENFYITPASSRAGHLSSQS